MLSHRPACFPSSPSPPNPPCRNDIHGLLAEAQEVAGEHLQGNLEDDTLEEDTLERTLVVLRRAQVGC